MRGEASTTHAEGGDKHPNSIQDSPLGIQALGTIPKEAERVAIGIWCHVTLV